MNPFKHPRAVDSVPIEQAFERYYPAIFRYFRYRGADADSANDLAATTFERALANLHRYDPRKAQIQTWLFTIAHNLSVNHWKSSSSAAVIALDDDFPIPSDPPLEDAVILAQDKAQILSALAALDARSAEVVALKFGGRLTNRQIADLTQHSESNVGVILYRALAKLRTLLSETNVEVPHERN